MVLGACGGRAQPARSATGSGRPAPSGARHAGSALPPPEPPENHRPVGQGRRPQGADRMAEGKAGGAAGLFAKQVQKKFSRAQEKVSGEPAEAAPEGRPGAQGPRPGPRRRSRSAEWVSREQAGSREGETSAHPGPVFPRGLHARADLGDDGKELALATAGRVGPAVRRDGVSQRGHGRFQGGDSLRALDRHGQLCCPGRRGSDGSLCLGPRASGAVEAVVRAARGRFLSRPGG